MSATNLTKNLKLPQFIASDKPSWLGDVNGAMKNIDDGIGVIKGDITKASDTASSAKSQSDANTVTLGNVNTELESIGNRVTALEAGGGTEQLEQRVNTNTSDIEALQTRADTFEEEIAENGTKITSVTKSVTELTPRVNSCENNITSLTTTTQGLSSSVESLSSTTTSLSNSVTTNTRNISKNTTDITNIKNTLSTIGGGIACDSKMAQINGSNIALNCFAIVRNNNGFWVNGFAYVISSANIKSDMLSFDTTGMDDGLSDFTTSTNIMLYYTSGSTSPTVVACNVNFYKDTHLLQVTAPASISTISSSGRPFIILNDTLS